MPPSFFPPQPKQWFVGFGSSLIVSLNLFPRVPSLYPYFITSLLPSSDQRHSASLRSSHAALPFAHFHFQHVCQRSYAARDFLLIQAGKAEAQSVRQRA